MMSNMSSLVCKQLCSAVHSSRSTDEVTMHEVPMSVLMIDKQKKSGSMHTCNLTLSRLIFDVRATGRV